MPRFLVGDKVTCKVAVEAFYSRSYGHPEQYFKPGMIGRVGAIRIGKRGPGGYPTDYCVDFEGTPYGLPNPVYTEWRCVLQATNIKRIK